MIDPTARIEATAAIGLDVTIGPYCTIGPHVTVGDGCRLIGHVNLTGHTTIGARTVIRPFVSLGSPPQSVHYRGGPTRLVVGAECDIRENVTMNIGTAQDRGATTVGDKCFLMVGSHVAHDCQVGSNVVQVSSGTANGSYTNSFTDLATITVGSAMSTNYIDVGGGTNKPSRYYRIDLRN